MSRIGSGEQIVVRPTNNVYTVLVISAVVVQIIAFVALIMRASALKIPFFGEAAP